MQLEAGGGGAEKPHGLSDPGDHLAAVLEALSPTRRDGLVDFLFPELPVWQALLDRVGVSLSTALVVAGRAQENGTDFQKELLASEAVGDERFFAAMAEEFGVGTADVLPPRQIDIDLARALMLLRGDERGLAVRMRDRAAGRAYAAAPSWTVAQGLLRTRREPRPPLTIVTPRTLRTALVRRMRPHLERLALTALFERFPEQSARFTVNAWQGTMVGVGLVGIPMALAFRPDIAFGALHVFFSFFFLSCVGLRFAALKAAVPMVTPPLPSRFTPDMPVYSVLVALHREAEVVPALLAAMERLQWPRSKLDVKFVCEADDTATLTALRGQTLGRHVEIVEVPPGNPRTKPKALQYTLPLARGELVVLYDAEDTPHPMQLVEAWQRFREGPADLACVQAPLDISNAGQGIVPRMFAFEYAALFRAMLPWLARSERVLPLGGTSNHFRRSVLDAAGGWDPYNVTEDADLGLRLARLGYRTATITLPTLEPAPDDFATWLPQRTRWFKGWLQTWLVHMRRPRSLWRDLGTGSFIVAQILFAGLIASALVHPILVVTAVVIATDIALQKPLSTWQSAMLVVDLSNITCGYASFLLLGWQSLKKPERKGFWRIVAFTPVYWMMMSAAAWRAVFQLKFKPHLWEKTPHKPQVSLD